MNIKIDYKNKLHSIGKDNTSLAQVADAIKVRYPGEFKHGVILSIIGDGNVHEVKTFEEVTEFWKKNGSPASVKIKVFEAPENNQKREEQKQIILDNADPVYTASVYEGVGGAIRAQEDSEVFEVREESRVGEEKVMNPFLKNKELDESMEVKAEPKIEQVVVPQAAQGFSLETINQLIEERVRSIIKELNLVTREEFEAEKQKKAQCKKVEEKSPSILDQIEKDLQRVNENCQVKPRGEVKPEPVKEHKAKFAYPPLNVVKAEPNSSFTWKVSFLNSGTTVWPKSTVYKTSKKIQQITSVKSLKPGESTDIVLDLIAPSSKGVEQKEFRLAYMDELADNLTFFGPKFGFQLQTVSSATEVSNLVKEKEPVKTQENRELRQKVADAARYVSNQKHDIDLLVKEIHNLGIDQTISKELLVDIIVQLQASPLH